MLDRCKVFSFLIEAFQISQWYLADLSHHRLVLLEYEKKVLIKMKLNSVDEEEFIPQAVF